MKNDVKMFVCLALMFLLLLMVFVHVFTYEEEELYGPTVYIAPTGKKYHYRDTCAGGNAIRKQYSQVSGRYSPCKKCAQ